MSIQYRWYQCAHPSSAHKYYFNPETGESKWHLEISEWSPDSVQYLENVGYLGVCNIIYYISFLMHMVALLDWAIRKSASCLQITKTERAGNRGQPVRYRSVCVH